MAKTRALVKRRKAIRNIRKITRTMELIATARFKKALDRAIEAEAYTNKIAELAADLSANATEIRHPLLEQRQVVRRSLLLVLCSNRGLCGGYNAAILREAVARCRQLEATGTGLQLELSGKRAIAYFRYQGMAAERTFTHFEDKPRFDEVDELAQRYLDDYIAGRIDRVEVAYMKFLNAARQLAVVETLLPLSKVTEAASRRPGRATAARPAVAYEFLPDPRDILEELLPVSFKVRLFKCFLDAAVSEQIARRVAMKAATENAGEMIKILTRQYNRARQAQITKEIAEVISGAEALK
ncbi:MAG: ATP synthase F1 subunit gamma [Gemmataceae bacterium]|nr:ATP synthase F1 subunit gamma [Gemmataceae bacterium]MDW8265120.1 ATP synthase F1 subunit gamma [Gemmataceae bacterium]